MNIDDTGGLVIRGDNQQFLETAIRNGVDFIVIGSVAAAYYKCRELDEINDLDLLINPTKENGEKVIRTLSNMHISVKWQSSELEKPAKQIPIKCNFCNVDILTPKNNQDYKSMKNESNISYIGNSKVDILSLVDLIKIKEETLNEITSEAEKHEKDLLCLKAV
ncbi:MAG: hypothetical protein H0W44_00855 [Gammaproteobacteria bacterium]|nr:hypothetical protein [Gammaproteobacteria bacterium]